MKNKKIFVFIFSMMVIMLTGCASITPDEISKVEEMATNSVNDPNYKLDSDYEIKNSESNGFERVEVKKTGEHKLFFKVVQNENGEKDVILEKLELFNVGWLVLTFIVGFFGVCTGVIWVLY